MSASFSADEVAALLGVTSPADVPTGFPCVSTDTRTLPPGALFVALCGEHFDGHEHLAAARDRGAAAAVVRVGTAPVAGLPLYPVADPLDALGRLAAAHRRRIPGPVVAITGQNGKTSTKEMVAAVLSTRWRTHRTSVNRNNRVGVPLTVLEAPADTEALVVEAGANLPGEIAIFRDILAPTVAIVTSAGAGHLEGFGTVERVVEEKLSLTLGVPLAIVGSDPPTLTSGARSLAARVITAGVADGDLRPDAVALQPDGLPQVTVDGQTFTLAARGLHQAGNAMLAWALVREYALDPAAAAAALGAFALPGGRGELTGRDGLTILNDAYNANPESFTSVIALAQSLRAGRRLIFVAGSMRELGPTAPARHTEVAAQLAELAPDVLALVGDFVPAFAPWRTTFSGTLLEAADAEAMGPLVAETLSGNDLLVLKGSRGVTLERILTALPERVA